MAKVIKKRKRIKVFAVLIALLLLSAVIYIGYILLDMPIRNIVIKGTIILKDQDIIEKVGIEDYPSFLRTSTNKIKKTLEKDPYVEKVTVKKIIFNKLVIEIKENKVLYVDSKTNTQVLSDGVSIEKDDNSLGCAILINEIDKSVKKQFIKKMNKIDKNILRKVSEIKYEPTTLDTGRFLFTMSDGNYVYLTLTKFENINYYEDVLPQLEGKKGILYLDSGNHFKIME